MLNERNYSLPYAFTGMALALMMLGSQAALAAGADAVEQGTNAHADGNKSIAIGKDATAQATGSIAVGERSKVETVTTEADLAGIAIGSNALVTNQFTPAMQRLLFFGTELSAANVGQLPAGIALGTNAYANTGSIHIGMQTYTGEVAGVTLAGRDPNADQFGMTTVGTNAYNQGLFATMFGSYSVATTDHVAGTAENLGQNFGATTIGTMNLLKSRGYAPTAGTANTMTGLANTVENANTATVFGSGNVVKNSIAQMTDFSTLEPTSPDDMVAKMQAELKAKTGGATTVVGGGNTTDWTQLTTVSGLNNTVTGTEAAPVTHLVVNGYKNTVTGSNHAMVTGSENTVTNTNQLFLFGDTRTLSGAHRSVIIGTADADTARNTSVERVVILGHNANATVEGGVALGAGSIASTAKGVAGYDPSTGRASTATTAVWQATEGALSVGDATNSITRQISNVAAGTADTDVVNVAQLKALQTMLPADGTAVSAPGTTFSVNGGSDADGMLNGPDSAKKNLVAAASTNAAGGLHYDVKLADTLTLGENSDENKVLIQGNTSTVVLGVDAKKRLEMNGAAGIVKYGEKVSISANQAQVKAGTVTVNGESNTVEGLSNTTWDSNNVVAGRAATEGQLKAVADAAQIQGAEIHHLQSDLHDARREVRDTGAMSAALAGLKAIPFDPNDKTQVMASMGFYRGSEALALGVGHYVNEDLFLHVGASMNRHAMWNVGLTYRFGRDKQSQPMTVATNTGSGELAVLKANHAALKSQVAEVAELKDDIAKLKALIGDLEAKVAKKALR